MILSAGQHAHARANNVGFSEVENLFSFFSFFFFFFLFFSFFFFFDIVGRESDRGSGMLIKRNGKTPFFHGPFSFTR